MNPLDLTAKASQYLNYLCLELPTRQVGSPGNLAATNFLANKLAEFGFEIQCPGFECLDWATEGANLTVGGVAYPAFPSPYSLGCEVSGRLESASSLEELEALALQSPLARSVLLLRGELAHEQLMPKNFPFYNPPVHQHILHLLEKIQPQALITASGRNPEMVGAVYPSPLIEDGDFDIPSVYLTEQQGERLAHQVGEPVSLTSQAWRIASRGCIVLASKGLPQQPRIVICAHVDSKIGTPGALDNAAGVTTLLLLGELLRAYAGKLGVEILIVNGEDNYAASGEKLYVERNQGKFDQILLNINLDAAGYIHGNTAYSLYDCPQWLLPAIQQAFATQPGMVEGELWYQSDHMVFVQNKVPAIAITSENLQEILATLAHTSQDTPDRVDPERLTKIALALHELVTGLDTIS